MFEKSAWTKSERRTYVNAATELIEACQKESFILETISLGLMLPDIALATKVDLLTNVLGFSEADTLRLLSGDFRLTVYGGKLLIDQIRPESQGKS